MSSGTSETSDIDGIANIDGASDWSLVGDSDTDSITSNVSSLVQVVNADEIGNLQLPLGVVYTFIIIYLWAAVLFFTSERIKTSIALEQPDLNLAFTCPLSIFCPPCIAPLPAEDVSILTDAPELPTFLPLTWTSDSSTTEPSAADPSTAGPSTVDSFTTEASTTNPSVTDVSTTGPSSTGLCFTDIDLRGSSPWHAGLTDRLTLSFHLLRCFHIHGRRAFVDGLYEFERKKNEMKERRVPLWRSVAGMMGIM